MGNQRITRRRFMRSTLLGVAGPEHHRNFLDCIKTRQPAAASADVRHNATTTCNLAEISARLGRRVKWDAQGERFVDDEEANRLLSRAMRSPGICRIRTIPTEIDYSRDFGPSDRPAWDAEYAANVKAMDLACYRKAGIEGVFLRSNDLEDEWEGRIFDGIEGILRGRLQRFYGKLNQERG